MKVAPANDRQIEMMKEFWKDTPTKPHMRQLNAALLKNDFLSLIMRLEAAEAQASAALPIDATAKMVKSALAVDWSNEDEEAVVHNVWHAMRGAMPASHDAKTDSERLDFLDEVNMRLNAKYGTTYKWKLIMNHNVNRLMLGAGKVDLNDMEANGLTSCRDAIDAARLSLSTVSQDANREDRT